MTAARPPGDVRRAALAGFAAFALAAAGARAQAAGPQAVFSAPVPAARVGLAPVAGTPLPADARFLGADGRPLRLGDLFGPTMPPTLLLLGWLRCPQLCGLAMHGTLEALHASGLQAGAARVLFVSLDPSDTPADAAARGRVDRDYERFLAGGDPRTRVPEVLRLVGRRPAIDALAHAVGARFASLPGGGIAHPAGVVVVTPAGRVSGLLGGVRFDPVALRTAVADADAGRAGPVATGIALLCAHLDPTLGRHSAAVLAGLRLAGLGSIGLLGLFVWRQQRRRRAA